MVVENHERSGASRGRVGASHIRGGYPLSAAAGIVAGAICGDDGSPGGIALRREPTKAQAKGRTIMPWAYPVVWAYVALILLVSLTVSVVR